MDSPEIIITDGLQENASAVKKFECEILYDKFSDKLHRDVTEAHRPTLYNFVVFQSDRIRHQLSFRDIFIDTLKSINQSINRSINQSTIKSIEFTELSSADSTLKRQTPSVRRVVRRSIILSKVRRFRHEYTNDLHCIINI